MAGLRGRAPVLTHFCGYSAVRQHRVRQTFMNGRVWRCGALLRSFLQSLPQPPPGRQRSPSGKTLHQPRGCSSSLAACKVVSIFKQWSIFNERTHVVSRRTLRARAGLQSRASVTAARAGHPEGSSDLLIVEFALSGRCGTEAAGCRRHCPGSWELPVMLCPPWWLGGGVRCWLGGPFGFLGPDR